MGLTDEVTKQAKIIQLIRALNVDEEKKLRISAVLHARDIDELVAQRDIETIATKLSGKRVILSPKQKELAVVVEYLTDFECQQNSL